MELQYKQIEKICFYKNKYYKCTDCNQIYDPIIEIKYFEKNPSSGEKDGYILFIEKNIKYIRIILYQVLETTICNCQCKNSNCKKYFYCICGETNSNITCKSHICKRLIFIGTILQEIDYNIMDYSVRLFRDPLDIFNLFSDGEMGYFGDIKKGIFFMVDIYCLENNKYTQIIYTNNKFIILNNEIIIKDNIMYNNMPFILIYNKRDYITNSLADYKMYNVENDIIYNLKNNKIHNEIKKYDYNDDFFEAAEHVAEIANLFRQSNYVLEKLLTYILFNMKRNKRLPHELIEFIFWEYIYDDIIIKSQRY